MATFDLTGTIVHIEREDVSKRAGHIKWMYRFDVEVDEARAPAREALPPQVRFVCPGSRLERFTATPFQVGDKVAFRGDGSTPRAIALEAAQKL
jgi:hypothetical protein